MDSHAVPKTHTDQASMQPANHTLMGIIFEDKASAEGH